MTAKDFNIQEIDIQDLNIQIEETFSKLLQLISSLNQEQLNTIPFEGSWTAGQLANHVIKYVSGFPQVLNGEVKETERQPNEKVKRIKNDFLNFNIKMESPDFIVPENTIYKKEVLLNSLERIKEEINQTAPELDLSKTCLAFELPVYGKLTRLEAIYFLIYHTQRHIHQLKNICKSLNIKRK